MTAAQRAPTILTERLRLDALRNGDAEAMHRYRADPEVARYQSWAPAAIDEVRAFIARLDVTRFGAPGSWSQLAVRLLGTGELVGDLGIHVLAPDGRQAEIGCTIDRARQRGGLASEAVTGVLGWLFGEVGVHRVVASTDPRNLASISLLERLGFRREAHFRESLWFKGGWVDDVVYAMLESEWKHGR